MNMTTLFERIAGKQHDRRQQHINSYRELVAEIANGHEPDADVVESTLAHAEKSLDDLRQAVELFQKRMALRATVASMPQFEAEQQDVQRQITQADKALAEAEKRHDEITEPLYSRLREIKTILSDGESAKRELFHTCDDPQLRQQLNEVHAELRKLSAKRDELLSHSAYLDDRAMTELSSAEREVSAGDIQHRREKGHTFRQQANSLRHKLQAIEKEQTALAKRQADIEQRMREW